VGSCSLDIDIAKRAELLKLDEDLRNGIALLGGVAMTDSLESQEGECDVEGIANCAPLHFEEVQVELRQLRAGLTDPPSEGLEALIQDELESPNANLMTLIDNYCEAHAIFVVIPYLETVVGELRGELDRLALSGCPCDILSLSPPALRSEVGGTVEMSVSGLEPQGPATGVLECDIGGVLSVPANPAPDKQGVVTCDVPPLSTLLPLLDALPAPEDRRCEGEGEEVGAEGVVWCPGRFQGGSQNDTVPLPRIEITLRGALLHIVKSSGGSNYLLFYPTPSLSLFSPQAIPSDATAEEQRITVTGSNLTDRVKDGPLLRLTPVGVPGPSFVLPLSLSSSSSPLLLAPSITLDDGEYLREYAVEVGYLEEAMVDAAISLFYYRRPSVLSVSPSSSPLAGGGAASIVVDLLPPPGLSFGAVTCKLGQWQGVTTRVTDTELSCTVPRHTLPLDSSWLTVGNVTVQLMLNEDLAFSDVAATPVYFAFECSQQEKDSGICCPPGTAGNPSLCLPCRSGFFSPVYGSAECLTCPPFASSTNQSMNCSCIPGHYPVYTTFTGGGGGVQYWRYRVRHVR